MDRRLPRRHSLTRSLTRLALALGAVVLAAPALSACGFNYATDRSNAITAGVSDQDGTIDVLNALIVSGSTGEGTFIATLANNDTTKSAHLTGLSFGSNATTQVAAFDPIEVKPGLSVNLADGQGIKVAGSAIVAGDFLTVSLTFDNGQTTVMQVPVVTTDNQYAGLDNGTGNASPSSSPTDSSVPSDSASPTDLTSPTASTS
jgi:hypothetical protein